MLLLGFAGRSSENKKTYSSLPTKSRLYIVIMALRLAPATPNKAALKKIQGQLKNAVTTYGTLILSWQSDICEIIKLVQYYKGLAIKSESIQKSIDGKSHFVTSIPDNERVGRQLLSSVRLDMEGTLMQTKTFE